MLNDGMVHCFVHQKTLFKMPSSILQCPTLIIFINFYYYKVDGLGGYCKKDLSLQNILKVWILLTKLYTFSKGWHVESCFKLQHT
jgi:hypothetical protein